MLPVLATLVLCRMASGVLFPAESEACLRSEDPLLPCVLSGAVDWAEGAAARDLHLGDGLVLLPDQDSAQLPPLGDPRETRTLVEAVERAVSGRRLVWGLGWLHPGLAMMVSRGPDPRLYFTVDPRAPPHSQESTGRLIVRRTLVPLLLGVNLKLVSLAPLLVAGLVLLAKKAFLLSKLSLLLSGLGFYRQYQQSQDHDPQPHYTRDWVWEHEPHPQFAFNQSFF